MFPVVTLCRDKALTGLAPDTGRPDMILAGREVTAIFTFDQWPVPGVPPEPGQLLQLSALRISAQYFPTQQADTRPVSAYFRRTARTHAPHSPRRAHRYIQNALLSSDKWSDLDLKAQTSQYHGSETKPKPGKSRS